MINAATGILNIANADSMYAANEKVVKEINSPSLFETPVLVRTCYLFLTI